MKRFFTILMLSLICVLCAVSFAACGKDNAADIRNSDIVGIYNTYVVIAEENGTTPLSYDEWLAQIKGEKGDKGEDGKDGINGIDGKDGKNGTDGKDGTNGNDGVGIKSAIIDENGNLVLKMTDDTIIIAGKIKDVHPHEIIEKEVIEREPTCTRVGLKYVYCDTCGEILKTVIVEKTQHDYEDIITPPTCTEQGYTTRTCKDCGHVETDTYTEIIPHTYIDTITKPTCTEQGYTTHTCSVCGYNYKDNYTTADTTEHNYIEKSEIYGNCALSMKQDYVCTRCQHEKTETITAQAPDIHNHLNIGDTCEHCGWSVYTKNGDSLLMKNADDKLSAEFYGTEMCKYDDSIKAYIINAYIAGNVTSIGDHAFYDYSSLMSVTIGNSVKSIGDYAFYHCDSLTEVTIGNSVTSIGAYAFDGCRSLASVTIPNSITNIDAGAFSGCNYLNKVNYTGTIDTWCEIRFGYFNFTYEYNSSSPLLYGRNLYINNELITKIEINNATRINSYAFHGCISLTDVTIGDSVTSIGSYAFYGCTSLTNITIPENITTLGQHALDGCTGIQETESGLVYVNNVIIGIAKTNGLPPAQCILRENTTIIANGAFEDNTTITSITIPKSVALIDYRAFCGCSSLTNITFNGTKQDWKNIRKNDDMWHYNVPTKIIHCTDGDLTLN